MDQAAKALHGKEHCFSLAHCYHPKLYKYLVERLNKNLLPIEEQQWVKALVFLFISVHEKWITTVKFLNS